MIKSKTVFVIGAGASVEAGLPDGNTLRSEIARKANIGFEHGTRQISGSVEIYEALRRQYRNTDVNPYLRAGRFIHSAMPQAISIDRFIDDHKDNNEVEVMGKLAITQCILEAERKSRFFVQGPNEDMHFHNIPSTWHSDFCKLLRLDVRKDDVGNLFNNISFVVFNYDRCLEHYLLHDLCSYYGLHREQAAEILNKAKFYHPYGTVGKLSWQSGPAPVAVYGQDGGDLFAISQQIKTYTERIDDSVVMASIRQDIQEARNIIFLGFAYHSQNMQLIKPPSPCSANCVIGTACMISASDQQAVSREIRNALSIRDKNHVPQLYGGTCAELFSEYRLTISDF